MFNIVFILFYFRFINSFIEFDHKLILLNTSIRLVRLRLFKKLFWILIFIAYLIYFMGTLIYFIYILKIPIRLHMFTNAIFRTPNLIMSVVSITSCFFLYNLGSRFSMLNSLCKTLQTELVTSDGKWTNFEKTTLLECIKYLHSELCDLLRIFSLGYGPVLLLFFSFGFCDILIDIFFITIYHKKARMTLKLLAIMYFSINIFNILTILYVTTWAIEKVCLI